MDVWRQTILRKKLSKFRVFFPFYHQKWVMAQPGQRHDLSFCQRVVKGQDGPQVVPF